jgi:hypothetical protein
MMGKRRDVSNVMKFRKGRLFLFLLVFIYWI